jgi:hypothetical protein
VRESREEPAWARRPAVGDESANPFRGRDIAAPQYLEHALGTGEMRERGVQEPGNGLRRARMRLGGLDGGFGVRELWLGYSRLGAKGSHDL